MNTPARAPSPPISGTATRAEHDALYQAVRSRDVARTRFLLTGGSDPNEIDSVGRTPLMVAACSEQPGLSMEPVDRFAWLTFQLRKRRPKAPPARHDLVRALLDAGANVGWRSFDDRNALMHAAAEGTASACAELLAGGAVIDERNRKGRTALMYAAYALNADTARLLVDRGAQVNLADANGQTALDLARLKRRNSAHVRACIAVLRSAGARTSRRLRWPGLEVLKRHFALDELDQYRRRPFRWAVSRSATVGIVCAGVPLLGADPMGRALAAGLIVVSLLAFPATLQLPYMLVARVARGRASARSESEPGETTAPEEGGQSADYVSSFVRLGWKSLARVAGAHVRARRLNPSYVMSAAFGVVTPVLPLAIQPPRPLVSGAFDFLELGRAYLVMVGALALMLWIEDRLRSYRVNHAQRQRDLVATEIARSLERRLERPVAETDDFLLYLRAFSVTGRLDVGGVDLETALADSLERMLPVVALGRPGEALGAGRILTTDEHWKEEVLRLIEKAALIMLIPSHREGTLWEIEQLRRLGHFGKTILVMPPDLALEHGRTSHAWRQATDAARALGLSLPPHFSRGLIFKLDDSGHLLEHAPFGAEPFLSEVLPRRRGLLADRVLHSPGFYDDLDLASDADSQDDARDVADAPPADQDGGGALDGAGDGPGDGAGAP